MRKWITCLFGNQISISKLHIRMYQGFRLYFGRSNRMLHFGSLWPLLASQSLALIDLSLKPNYHGKVVHVQIPDTNGICWHHLICLYKFVQLQVRSWRFGQILQLRSTKKCHVGTFCELDVLWRNTSMFLATMIREKPLKRALFFNCLGLILTSEV